MQVYGGIEAGGTKFVCAVAEAPDGAFLERISIQTTTPGQTIGEAIQFFRRFDLRALGVASFGPVDLNPRSPTYGYITTTPKNGWRNTDLLGPLRQTFGIPMGFDTDVNGAALGEMRYGAGREGDSDPLVYFTIGTGIGGGAVINGQTLHGILHPEMGHIMVKHHPDDPFAGRCPFHKDCLEGMANGPSIGDRWKIGPARLPEDHPAWDIEAYYLAQAVCTTIYMLSPCRVILGGGVMHQKQLFPMIRRHTLELLKGYISIPGTPEAMDRLIVPPALVDDAGIRGALELARLAGEPSNN
ncbi:MAG TPA: ROK family protein [Aggregatilineales bacterium]|nr:ROK family protein [Aggregatilineales bacterium]